MSRLNIKELYVLDGVFFRAPAEAPIRKETPKMKRALKPKNWVTLLTVRDRQEPEDWGNGWGR